jgi:hypothetical protein
MIALWLLACAPNPTKSEQPVDSPDDTPPVVIRPDGLPHLPWVEPEEPNVFRAAVVPTAPAFTDDLRCEITADLLVDIDTITWTVDGDPWTGPTTTSFFPGDTIDDLDQSGGQAWACTATLASGTSAASPQVTVAHPVAMVVAPPGTTRISVSPYRGDVTITRAYWMAETELSRQDWITWAGYDAPGPLAPRGQSPDLTFPADGLRVPQAFWLADHLSRLDGLQECYACSGPPESAQCTRPPNPYACVGYRLPTWVEWVLAYREGGHHRDPLPAGGVFEYWHGADVYGSPYDREATGPHAPPNTKISDQCWTSGWMTEDAAPVRTLLPNSLGLFNMCSNAPELFTDSTTSCGRLSLTSDPMCPDTDPTDMTEGECSSMTPWSAMTRIDPEQTVGTTKGAIRLTRTIHPRSTP